MSSSRQTIVLSNVTAAGTGDVWGYFTGAQPGVTRAMHVVASGNFSMQVRGTNFFTETSEPNGRTAVGSNWTDVGSPIVASGMYRFDTNLNLDLYHIEVTSVANRVDAIVV